MKKVAKLTIQQWGNSLAVRIPSATAKAAHFSVGQPVEITVEDSSVVVTPIGQPRMTLAQKLASFDPIKHGGEAMVADPIGAEAL